MKPRPLTKVIQAVLNATPNNWEGRELLVMELDHMMEDAKFMAPEEYSVLWQMFCQIAQRHFQKVDCSWKQTVSGIITNKIDYNAWLNQSEKEDER